MVGLAVFEVFQPLLQLAVTADLKRRQLRTGAFEVLAEIIVDGKGLRCVDAHGVERVHEDAVNGVAHGLGRAVAGGCLVPVLR